MSTKMMSEIKAGLEGPVGSIISAQTVECDCCGLIEECTPSYIQTVREMHGGKWVCGLCAEAVKDEVLRCEKMLISPEEAMDRHLSFCNKVRASGPPKDSTVRLIRAMSRVMRRSFESPKLTTIREGGWDPEYDPA
ncbi:uncharacterized protein LOC127243518 [Andrographis paniculata]|uniref:uncharacterized protein LOC127243518 n=1 Tax=Andrographis paniculata TaxID=175694 RepID=UPI0021E7558E|nr:uncharacterized protein LOC127243518 [Andrographis paniculata]